ncbi:transferase family-domain-containing protein [Kickxella alabastrina]|uniref:transferase family-domain-containing protein n=1 Tax=Kickxella alabastrina TaxID=61397 RepID=UPI00221F822F|nr:transferase family-domain-containing protein [Kickxella alabastrina]KAI7832920.1 transferase family-domain-containing protein [Kickxella alabastrina]
MTIDNYFVPLANIKAQEIELSTFDLAVYGIIVGDIYFYKNEQKDASFMPFGALAQSFCMLVADHYPVIVGRPTVNSAGKGVMAVDPSNLCLPDIAEVFIDHPIELFLETRPSGSEDKPNLLFFNTRKFHRDSGVDCLPQVTYKSDHSAAIVRVLRFKNSPYVGISFASSHMLYDGIGLYAFMNHWAEYMRNLNAIRNGTYQLAEPPINNRQVMTNCLDKVEPLELPFIKHFKEILPPMQMPFPTNIAPVLLSSPDMPLIQDQHVLHFSPANLERMRQHIDKDQTVNTVLAAFLARNILLANINVFGTEPKTSYVMMAYDGRTRSAIPRNFSGNVSSTAIAPLPSQMVLTSSYRDLARAIKEHCSKTEIGHTKAAMLVIENELSLLYQIGLALCNTPMTSYIGMTNLRYMPFDSVDFGFGQPVFLGLDYFQKQGISRLLPNKQDGGVDLYLNYMDANFKVFCQLDEVKMLADVIY